MQEAKDKFPDFDYSKSKYLGAFEPITFDCPIHGEQKRRASDFLKGNYGCSACGNDQTGYAGYRIRRLQSGDPSVKSRPTRIALMKMDVWGIKTYKLGITTRTLEARYREAMVTVYFEAILAELDALMLEQLLHQKYRNDQDNRVKFKGMQDGKRWSGDEELYFKRTVKPMLSDLKYHVQELSCKDPNYWDRFPELEIPSDKPRESTFGKGKRIIPRPVISLDTKEIYPSATEAARRLKTSQGDLSSVCRGKRRTTKGLRFAYLDDYEQGTVPIFKPLNGNKRRVRCVDTGKVYTSAREAAGDTGASAGKIDMVCQGKRKTTGGLRWEYVDEK